jgi:hypothetical protein
MNAAAFVASDALIEAIGHDQPRVVKEVEVGAVGSATASELRSLAFRGVPAAAGVMAAEIPGAIAGVVAAGETYSAIRPALDRMDPDDRLLQDDAKDLVSDFSSGVAAGVATSVATDVLVGSVGVGAALLTGTELGAAFGTVGGPPGVVLGALAGAIGGGLVGMGAWLVGKL